MTRRVLQTVRSWLPAVLDLAAVIVLAWGAAQVHDALAALVVAVGLTITSWRLSP